MDVLEVHELNQATLTEDIFDRGLDSLQALALVRQIRSLCLSMTCIRIWDLRRPFSITALSPCLHLRC
jgi:aryl carrier-like protein